MFNAKSRSRSQIIECEASDCSFNQKNKCRAIGINVGGPEPLCDTFINADVMGGILNAATKVGACKVQSCVHNKLLECGAEKIRVLLVYDQALCGTYQL